MSLNLNEIKAATKFLHRKIVDTPFLNLASSKVKILFPEKTKVKMKLVFSAKPRSGVGNDKT